MTAAGPRPLFGLLPWLLASVAAHAVLLVPWPQAGAPVTVVEAAAGSAAVQMQLLRRAEPAQVAAAQPAPATPATPHTARTAPARPRAATAARNVHPQTAPAPRRQTSATVQTGTAAQTGVTQTHSATTTATPGSDAERASAAAGWAELMSLLHAAIDRHKRYPQSALSMGREGSARVDFRLRPDGHIDDLNIGVSSGMRALDLAAYRAVQAIAPFTDADRYLDGAQRFQVDVVFRIN